MCVDTQVPRIDSRWCFQRCRQTRKSCYRVLSGQMAVIFFLKKKKTWKPARILIPCLAPLSRLFLRLTHSLVISMLLLGSTFQCECSRGSCFSVLPCQSLLPVASTDSRVVVLCARSCSALFECHRPPVVGFISVCGLWLQLQGWHQ